MAKSPIRQNPLRTNKYQRRIIAVPFLSLLFMNLIGTAIIFYYRPQLFNAVFPAPQSYDFINHVTILILMVMWFFFVIVTIWAFMVASDLVGSFERITNELKDIVDKGVNKRLNVRFGDHPADELVKQINNLIKHRTE
ncbi:MAG: hypothetical protein KKD07_06740 [Candidatus Omnitrophica bacterium]|nr:hypothetical protein [Candidatus Omnitrophota bacterium]MBU1995527.1 hypothetical protein [Candidatus Omnitrophota bacterium]MBU4334120.1 hypothetical protein [Candidatus Omnitrophota bacterium]